MGAPYQSQSAAGYNSSPPPDDGSTVAANKITWAKIKSALADSIKTLADAINTQLRTALNVSPSTTSIAYTTVVGDHLTTIEVTGTTTISLGDAATMIAQSMGYQVTVRNKGTAFVKVTPITGTDTLDGIAAGVSMLSPGQSKTFGVAQSGVGYGTISESFTGDPEICEFRLTLTTGTPVTTADVTAAGTLYCTPYKGNRISLFDGTGNWNTRPSAEFSLALTLTSGKPYDIFCYDNAGVPTLEVLVWTNDTTRATALALQNGVLVKTGATTRRYLGTLYSSGANTTEDSLAKRYLWNYYNRVRRSMLVREATDTWTYTTATIRQANGSAANQLDFVIGYTEDAVSAEIKVGVNNGANAQAQVGFGLDSTSTFVNGFLGGMSTIPSANAVQLSSAYEASNAPGRHTLCWNEYSAASGTTTWYGDNGQPTIVQAGIKGVLLG